jgi:outer membrane protein TolC
VTCFENAALIGFVHVFSSADELLAHWEAAQQVVLSRHSATLRAAGAKAWNVYSVFLAEEQAPTQQRAVERIEENFSLTRKIARAGMRTQDDVERALLSLTAVKAQPILSDADFQDRLRARLKDVSAEVLTAFLGDTSAEEVAKILVEKP